MPKKSSQISASILAWAQALGMTHANFTNMLRRCDVEYTPGKKLLAHEVFRAVRYKSEKDEAIARQANAKAEEQEMINAERRKELMELAQIEKVIWGDLLAPLRTEMEQMPKSLCGMCNPEEPEVAEQVLLNWVEKVKNNIKPK